MPTARDEHKVRSPKKRAHRRSSMRVDKLKQYIHRCRPLCVSGSPGYAIRAPAFLNVGAPAVLIVSLSCSSSHFCLPNKAQRTSAEHAKRPEGTETYGLRDASARLPKCLAASHKLRSGGAADARVFFFSAFPREYLGFLEGRFVILRCQPVNVSDS